MSEQKEGPWIEHDGKGYPKDVVAFARSKGILYFRIRYEHFGRKCTPLEAANDMQMDPNHPGWTWKRKYVLFGPYVASDPDYARVLKYRFIYPPAASIEKSASVELLREIAAGKRDPVAEPTQKEAAT